MERFEIVLGNSNSFVNLVPDSGEVEIRDDDSK